jgi:hypothetical protein
MTRFIPILRSAVSFYHGFATLRYPRTTLEDTMTLSKEVRIFTLDPGGQQASRHPQEVRL